MIGREKKFRGSCKNFSNFKLLEGEQDKWLRGWLLQNGKFLIKTFYNFQEGGSELSCLAKIWKNLVSPRVMFFAVAVTWSKALTLDNVKKRGGVFANCYDL